MYTASTSSTKGCVRCAAPRRPRSTGQRRVWSPREKACPRAPCSSGADDREEGEHMSNAAAFSGGGYVANLGPSEEGYLMPAVDEEGGFFWEGTLAGELRIQVCESCGKLRHPPRPMCTSCRSTARGWRRVDGRGTIWSFVV